MMNRTIFITGFFLILFFLDKPAAQQSSPLLNRVVQTGYDLVYDTKAWAFNTGAAVRSTPLIKNGIIYFGNAKGEFYAINQKTGLIKWKFRSGAAIHSSASIANGKVFFADNKQSVYALDEQTGRELWMYKMGEKLIYPWRFDYYQSSPTLYEQDLLVGGDDGYLYRLNQASGRLTWKFHTKGLVRSTPAVYKNTVLFGDTEASFYAVDLRTGKKKWEYKITGDSINNEKYGYDKRAITSSAAVSGNKVLFGSRDAHLYCLDIDSGSLLWKITHEPSWIISTVAVKDSFVITGTSDGRFVQALHLETGNEIWKHRTALAVWASPLINNDKVYTGGFDGQLLCLDLKTGRRISQFCTNGIIFSSPVLKDSILYFGSDDGNLYALSGRKPFAGNVSLKKFVYHNNQVPLYFRGGSDERIKRYLVNNGFTLIAADTLGQLFSDTREAGRTVIIVDAAYFPKAVWENNENSLLRKFVDAGGRVVLIGDNPLFFDVDDVTKDINGLSIDRASSVFGINFGPNDTRAFGGLFPSFPSQRGKDMGLPEQWISNFGLNQQDVDIVLGRNENGLATAWVKRYSNNGTLIQLYLNAELPVNMDAIIKVSEEVFD